MCHKGNSEVQYSVIDPAPELETKTALKENATGLQLSGRAVTCDDDPTEKICALDPERAGVGVSWEVPLGGKGAGWVTLTPDGGTAPWLTP